MQAGSNPSFTTKCSHKDEPLRPKYNKTYNDKSKKLKSLSQPPRSKSNSPNKPQIVIH